MEYTLAFYSISVGISLLKRQADMNVNPQSMEGGQRRVKYQPGRQRKCVDGHFERIEAVMGETKPAWPMTMDADGSRAFNLM